MLRAAADEAAAQRGAYVRLASIAPALSAPEQAAVAAFERIDLVEVDPMGEIVGAGVDPDRALADHAYAGRLLARAGGLVLFEAGPLVVGPDFASGQSAEPSMLAGRALALQLVTLSFARAAGMPASQVLVAGVPDWVQDDRDAAPQMLANILLRRALWPESPIAIVEPTLPGVADATWPFLVAATIAGAGGAALVLARTGGPSRRAAVASIKAAAHMGAGIGGATTETALAGPALDYARRTAEAALSTLERLRDVGWRAVLGQPPVGPPRDRLGADAVAERSEPFDPFGAGEPAVAGLR
jgi:hypothetical protein